MAHGRGCLLEGGWEFDLAGGDAGVEGDFSFFDFEACHFFEAEFDFGGEDGGEVFEGFHGEHEEALWDAELAEASALGWVGEAFVEGAAVEVDLGVDAGGGFELLDLEEHGGGERVAHDVAFHDDFGAAVFEADVDAFEGDVFFEESGLAEFDGAGEPEVDFAFCEGDGVVAVEGVLEDFLDVAARGGDVGDGGG